MNWGDKKITNPSPLTMHQSRFWRSEQAIKPKFSSGEWGAEFPNY
jgi:hypothetical protein